MAENGVVHKVLAHNPDCVWAIAYKRKFHPTQPAGEGFIAMLPLTAKGLFRLATKNFNGADPDLSLIAGPGERPAGLYMWATYAPGLMASAISLFMDQIADAPYDGVNLYSRPNTEEGVRYNQALGLKPAPVINGVVASHLYEFMRAKQNHSARPCMISSIPRRRQRRRAEGSFQPRARPLRWRGRSTI